MLSSAKSTSLSKVGLLLFCRNYLAGLICNSYRDYHPFPSLLTIRMSQVILCPQQNLSFNTQQKQHSLYLQYTIVLWNCKWVPLSPFTTNPFETLKHPQIIVIVQIPDLLITYTLEKNHGWSPRASPSLRKIIWKFSRLHVFGFPKKHPLLTTLIP